MHSRIHQYHVSYPPSPKSRMLILPLAGAVDAMLLFLEQRDQIVSGLLDVNVCGYQNQYPLRPGHDVTLIAEVGCSCPDG